MLFIMEGIDLALLIQIFKGFKLTLPRPQVLPIFAGRGSPFFPRGGVGRTSLLQLHTMYLYQHHLIHF